jgi:hypothetical protein
MTDTDNQLVEDYVCATCWGLLAEVFENGQHIVKCTNPDCTGEGFVTKAYANRRKQDSLAERREARDNLTKILNLPRKSKEQLLKELGF